MIMPVFTLSTQWRHVGWQLLDGSSVLVLNSFTVLKIGWNCSRVPLLSRWCRRHLFKGYIGSCPSSYRREITLITREDKWRPASRTRKGCVVMRDSVSLLFNNLIISRAALKSRNSCGVPVPFKRRNNRDVSFQKSRPCVPAWRYLLLHV